MNTEPHRITKPAAPATAPAADPAAYVRILNVTKKFGDFVAVDNVSLDIRRGEIFCLLGGSGSGKTTLLRMLAGFETPTSGALYIDGADMSTIPPYERPVNMMFQSYALFPHMNVEKNVAFGLEQEGVSRADIRRQVEEILEIVKMGGFSARKPHQLSGGQRQRIALARALVKRPSWTSSSTSATRWRIWSRGTRSCFRPKATFCSTVMCGNRA